MTRKTPRVTGRHVQPLFLFQLALFSSCSPLMQERICEGASTHYVEVLTIRLRPSLYVRKKQLACRYFSRLFLIVQLDPMDSDFALTSVHPLWRPCIGYLAHPFKKPDLTCSITHIP